LAAAELRSAVANRLRRISALLEAGDSAEAESEVAAVLLLLEVEAEVVNECEQRRLRTVK
jgi:hypothetical protein